MSVDTENKALLPTGLHDLLPPRAAQEADTVRALTETFAAFGYEQVKPPLVEFENTLTGLPASVYFDLDDERLIVVEELAFCRDGRGIYLEQSANPEAIGETFGWEVYIDRSDTTGMFHIVLIAAPDSPITHDGSDPKRLDITWEPTHNVITADVGSAMVGIFADGGQQVREMCAG